MSNEAQGGSGVGRYPGVCLEGKPLLHRSMACIDLHGFVVASLLSGVVEDSESHTTEETRQVFVLYPPQLSTHQLALPPWESPREDRESEIDASARVSLLVVPISVWILCKSAGGVCLPSDHRGYLFGIQMWAAGPGGGA